MSPSGGELRTDVRLLSSPSPPSLLRAPLTRNSSVERPGAFNFRRCSNSRSSGSKSNSSSSWMVWPTHLSEHALCRAAVRAAAHIVWRNLPRGNFPTGVWHR